MEELFDTEGIDIDMSEELPEESTEEVSEVEDNNSDQVPYYNSDSVHNEQTEEQSEEVSDDSEKVEKALRKILEDISDKEEFENEEEGSEIVEDKEEEKEDEPETNINTSDVSDVEPLLNDIIREIKESDSSKEVTGMYNTLTSVADSNTLNGKLNEQSATNVILIAILTVLMLDIAIHFCKGVL